LINILVWKGGSFLEGCESFSIKKNLRGIENRLSIEVA
jgi:hypothetical protein